MDAAPPRRARDWSLLPIDALASVFVRLDAFAVFKGAGLVCRSWLDAAKVPDMWRVVDLENREIAFENFDVWRARAKAAVDCSGGQLRVFAGKLFITEELMLYILERSPLLTSLRLVSCLSTLFSARVADVIKKSPLRELRTLELDNVDLTVEELTDVLENCPVLEVLTVRDCLGMEVEDEQVLRTKFARIKTLTFKPDDECFFDDF